MTWCRGPVPETDRGRPLAIGIWGTFDLDNYGDLLFPRIIRREVVRRLPEAIVRIFGPRGYESRLAFGDAEAAEPLGRWTKERRRVLADELDAVIVGGGDLIHGRDADYSTWYRLEPGRDRGLAPSKFFVDGLGASEEARCPVLWSAVGVPYDLEGGFARRVRTAVARRPYGSVRDTRSLRRIEAIGAPNLEVVPDPGFLLPRHFGQDRLAHRLRYLRARGWFPPQGPAVVVQAHSGYIEQVHELAASVGDLLGGSRNLNVVLVETGPCHGDGAFADALQPFLPVPPFRVPPVAGLASIVAAIAGSVGFVGSSLHGAITAFSFGRPLVLLSGADAGKLRGFTETIGRDEIAVVTPAGIGEAYERARRSPSGGVSLPELQARLDLHFDRLVDVILRSSDRRRPPSPRMLELGATIQGVNDRAVEALRLAEEEATSLARTVLGQREEIDRLGDAVDSLKEQLTVAERTSAEAEGRIALLTDRLVRLQGKVDELEGRLKEVIGSRSYQVGRRIVRTANRLASMLRLRRGRSMTPDDDHVQGRMTGERDADHG